MELPQELTPIESDILNFIKGPKFPALDNTPRSIADENEMIMERKASFLIYAAVGTEQFTGFMKDRGEKAGSVHTFKMAQPIRIAPPWHIRIGNLRYKWSEFVFTKVQFDVSNDRIWERQNHSGNRQTHGVAYQPHSLFVGRDRLDHMPELVAPLDSPDPILRAVDEGEFQNSVVRDAIMQFSGMSLYTICSGISGRNTLSDVLDYFDCSASAYGKFTLPGNSLSSYYYYDNNENKGNWSQNTDVEDDIVAHTLAFMVTYHDYNAAVTNLDEDSTEFLWTKVYSFKNHKGDTVQKAMRVFDWQRQSKLILPYTPWKRKVDNHIISVCTPLQTGQILYNLDLLTKSGIEAVIITDSVEIACECQKKHGNGACVWTSFLSLDNPALVDWSPLKVAGIRVYYMIANHSGWSMVEAYSQARKLGEYLKDEQKVYLTYIQVAIQQTENCTCSMNDKRKPICMVPSTLNRFALKSRSSVSMHDGSVRVLSEPEFDEMCKRAEDEANVYKPEFWEDDDEPDAVSSEIPNGANSAGYRASRKLEAEPLLMRPVIYPGKLHFIYSFRGIGKTSFAISLCASIVSGNRFLEGRAWTPPARGSGEFHKVVYFLLEEKDTPDDLMRRFGIKYMPTEKKHRDACISNFRILRGKDVGSTDLTDEASHDRVIRILDSMFTEGSCEGKVDLVVFDTYDVIVGGPDYVHKFNLVKPLFDRIMSKGTAVLVIAHTDQPGRNGKLRGGSAKEDGVSCSFKLWRDPGARSKTLDSPLFVSIEKPSKIACGFDCEDFSVKHTDGEWRVCLDSTVNVDRDGTELQDEDFEICSNCDGSECGTACDGRCNAYCKVAGGYQYSNYKVRAIAEMMGYAKGHHYDVLEARKGAVSKAKIKAEAERSRKAKAIASAKGN